MLINEYRVKEWEKIMSILIDKDKEVLLIGSYSQGGIASVVNNFLESELKNEFHFEASYIEAPTWKNWVRFIFFYFKIILVLLINTHIKVVHILSAEKGSFLRKAILLNLSKLFGKKVIINFHSGSSNLFFNDSFIVFKSFIKRVLNKADIILVLSTQWKESISKKCDNQNIEVLYNPVILKDLNEKITSPDEINVLFMGRIGLRKGAYDIVKAVKLLQNPNIKVDMYGDGEVDNLRALVLSENLSSTIRVNGWISGEKVSESYKNADIFILPSYDEGLPMSILEAMSYGLPVVSTKIGGIPDQIIDGVNGYLINAGNIEHLADKINTLANDPNLRREMGRKGHDIIRNKFDKKIIVNQLISLYARLK